jgi:hypothetical protein
MPYNFYPEDVELTQFEKDVFSSIYFYDAVERFIKSYTKPDGMSDADFRNAVIIRIQNQINISPTAVHIDLDLLKEIRDDAETRKQCLDNREVVEVPDSWKKVLQ